LTVGSGTAIATLRIPEPKSKKNRALPSSTMMHVPAWACDRDRRAADERIRISSAPSSSCPGNEVVADEIGVGR
jgi:hypothetical protein